MRSSTKIRFTQLANKKYIGVYTYRDIEIPDGIPRIISDELFNKVQEILGKNKKAPARAKATIEYILTTKIFCGHCRAMMTGVSGTARNGTRKKFSPVSALGFVRTKDIG